MVGRQNNSLSSNPKISPAILTIHGQLRLSQRNFNQIELNYIFEHGRLIRKTGICFIFLGKKDIPLVDRKLQWVQHLSGATVLVSADKVKVITMYKNQRALLEIKRKAKYRTRST